MKIYRLLSFIAIFLVLLCSSYITKAEIIPHFAIITTSDIQSQIFPDDKGIGGLARIATLKKRLEESVHATLMVSTGDDLMGTFYAMFKGRVEIKAMNLAGYDIVTPGNHEFDQGVKTYLNAISSAHFEIVSSNLSIKNEKLKSLIKPFVIKNMGGIRIGVFGLMTPDLKKVSNIGDEVNVDCNLIRKTKEMVSFLRNNKKVQVVIALTHIGTNLDRKIAHNVKGIDVIIGGHSHEYINERISGPDGWITHVFQAGAGGKVAGILTFNFNNGVKNVKWQLVKLDSALPEDVRVKDFISPFLEKYERSLNTPIGESLVDLDARKEVVRVRESGLGDMIAESWIEWFCKDNPCISLVNGGGIRGDRIYPKGVITYKEILSIHPFRNSVCLVTLKGKDLKKVLEISASALRTKGDGCPECNRPSAGGFLQVGGLRMTIDVSKTPFCAVYNGRDIKKILFPGERVKDIKIMDKNGGWKDIDPEKDYRVLISSWLASGGDGYYIFRELQPKNSTVLLSDVLINYIKKHSPIAPKTDGRIKIAN